jgi:uncharacterized protein YoxC
MFFNLISLSLSCSLSLSHSLSPSFPSPPFPTYLQQPRGRKIKTSKSLLEHIKLQLDTQTRVSESLEHERDKAYDDYQMAQAQLHTLIRQYQDLAGTCSEVARERDKAKAEVQLLREDLHRCVVCTCTVDRVILVFKKFSSTIFSFSDEN